MPAEDFLLGLAHLTAVAAAVLVAAGLTVRRRLGGLSGAPQAVAFGVIATTGIVAVHVVPGFLGILSRGSVLAAGALVLALAWLLPSSRPGPEPTANAEPPASGPLSSVVALAAASVAAVAALGYVEGRRTEVISAVDMLTFHLPGVARWIQTGSMWNVNQFVPDLAHGNYPNNGDVMHLALVLPWHNDAFVRFAELPFLALTAVAVYALACELGAPRASAVAFASVVISLPTVLVPSVVEVMPDATMFATFSAGLLFLVRHARTAQTSDLVLAGLGLGLSFGTKWYGLSSVAAVLVVWTGAMLVAGRRPAVVARAGLSLVGLVALSSGFWFVRNLVESGNPLFPVKVAPLGLTIFDAPPDPIRERFGFTIAGYADDPGVWERFILPGFERGFGLGGAVLGLGLILVSALLLRFRLRSGSSPAPNGPVLALAAATVLLAIVYTVTPYSALGPEGRPLDVVANARYLVPALIAAAALAAWSAGRIGRFRPLLEIAALAGVVDGVRRSFDLGAGELLTGLVVVAAIAAVVGGVVALLRAGRPLPAVALAAVALAAGAVVADRSQEAFNDGRYRVSDPVLARVAELSGGGVRIGLAGNASLGGLAPAYPSFGPRLRNEVAYVGPWVREMLREYPDRSGFTARLAEDRPDLLVVGTGAPVPQAEVREAAWAQAAGYEVVARSKRLILLRAPSG